MADILQRVIAEKENFFGVACDTTQLVTEACRRHDVGPVAGAALARGITGAVLLASLLKDEQSVLLRFEGNGPLKKLIAEAGTAGWARGYVAEPKAELPLINGKIDVAGGIGRAGFLTVIKDIGMKEKYQGTVQLYTSEIAEDIAYYLSESEQIPSAVSLGVHFEKDGTIAAAGGFIVQSLPPADETVIAGLEQRIAKMDSVTSMLKRRTTPAEILQQLFAEIPHKETGSTKLKYQCSCSREKMAQALFSLGQDEIEKILQEEEKIQVNCEFCRDSYSFTKEDMKTIFPDQNSIQ